MVHGRPDLQDALVEPSDRARLGTPEILERFVLLEILSAVELRNAVEEKLGSGLVTAARTRLVAHRCAPGQRLGASLSLPRYVAVRPAGTTTSRMSG